MRTTRALGVAAVLAGVMTMTAGPSATAAPTPLGLDCASIDSGVRHCPGDGDALRVPSFDGVPIDVDVTLPPSGDGPWPTIVLINGLGGDKAQLQTNVESPPSDTPPPLPPDTTHYNNEWFASRGYAVVALATRGFGGSCGFGALGVGTQGGAKVQTGACADGFVRVADARYEARDVQHLLGLLVDQGISEPTANGATGFSYGGGISAILGALNDRVMCDGIDRGDLCDGVADGEFVDWTSPDGTPMAMGAVYGQWLWTDLIGSVLVNGRFLDFDDDTIDDNVEPLGVYLKSYIDALLLLSESRGYVQTVGTGELEWDLEAIVAALNAGEPYDPFVDQILDAYLSRHGALGIGGDPAPILMQSGWTDDVFPPRESLKLYNDLHRRFTNPDVALLLSDYGHSRSSNRPGSSLAFNDAANAFFDSRLKGEGDGPASGSVVAYTTTCPATGDDAVAEGGPYTADSWAELADGSLTFGDAAAQTVANPGGDPQIGFEFDPIPQTNPVFATFDPCKAIPEPSWPPDTVALYDAEVTEPTLLLGLPTIRATIETTGAFGQLNGRLYDVDADGDHRLITRGVYRLEEDQTGEVVFQLQGNGYTFEPGSTIRLELAPSDAPQFRQADDPFRVTVTDLTVELPTRTIEAAADDTAGEDDATDVAADTDEDSGSLAATGGGAALVALGLVGAATALHRRRP